MQAKRQWVTRQVSLIERFEAVLYPIDLLALLDRLPDNGWVVPERIAENEQIRVRAPEKGNVRLLLDQERHTLGVGGRNLIETLSAYREIRALARDVSDITPDTGTDYVELRYVGRVEAIGSPTKVFARWWSGNEGIARLGVLLGEKLPSDATTLSPYGLRFASSGLDPNRKNWAELTISPVNIPGSSRYHFDLIFRNTKSSVTEEVAEKTDELLEIVLRELERE